MKLIDEKLVEEKALKYSIDANTDRLQQIEDNGCYDFEEYISEAVKEGVDFAEQQLKQKMIEFAEWMKEQPILICQTTNGHQWSSSYMGGGYYTSEQLLEEFINQQK